MSVSRLSPRFIVAILIAVAFGISLIFRVVLPFDQVFGGDFIKYTGVDAYFHMRLVDNMVHNFPHLTSFDPYFYFPGGAQITNSYFPDWVLAGIIWLFGLGSPTQHTTDVISVLYPAMIAALTVIPVYFIGKALFNRWVGVIAAFLMAVLPGEYLGRTILGLNDTPGIEVLLSTTFIAFMIWAVKTARERGLTFDHILKLDRSVCVKPLVLSALAGAFLGMYLISWIGALLFVFIFVLYLVVRFIKDHLAQRSADYLSIVSIISLVVALIIFAPITQRSLYVVSLVLAIFFPVVLIIISRLMAYKNIKTYYYPVALVVIGGIAAAIFYGIKPDLLQNMLSRFDIFAPVGATAVTTIETQPFLAPAGEFSTAIGWGNFTTTFFLFSKFAFPGVALIALGVLIYLFIRNSSMSLGYLRPVIWTVAIILVIMIMLLMSGYGHRYWALAFAAVLVALLLMPGDGKKNWTLFLVWSLVILMLALGQRRFAYYLVVNIAVLSAYLCWQLVWLAGLRKMAARSEDEQEKEHYYVEAPKRRDYYELLGVTQSASYREIKKAFRSLSHKYHSDASRSPEAEDRFKEINEAFEVLSNPEKRAAYNRSRHGILADKRKAGKKAPRRERQGISIYVINTAVLSVALFFLVFFPNIIKATEMTTTEEAPYSPTDAWMESLLWMRDNTPDPMGDPEAYYKLYDPPPPGERFPYPDSAYGVTSWWDYGYWITQIAHRLPSANPGQDPARLKNVANLLLSRDDESAREMLEKMGTSYVVIDNYIVRAKFWAVVEWAEQEEQEYYDIFFVPYEGRLQAVQFFLPAYYETLAVRLYNFNGEAVTEFRVAVITYVEKQEQGLTYKQVTDFKEFTSYREAQEYYDSLTSGNNVIVGVSPFITPIALEEVRDFRLVHSSEQGSSLQNIGFIPEVKIFEYTGRNK